MLPNYITDTRRNLQEFLPSEHENHPKRLLWIAGGKQAKGREMLYTRFVI